MKAIQKNGSIKIYKVLPETWDSAFGHIINFRQASNEVLKENGFYDVVKKYLLLAGYAGDKQFGPQLLRRSFGVWWLLDGGDMKSLSLIMGHKSISTTDAYYTPLAINDVIEIHHKHTPGRVFEEVK